MITLDPNLTLSKGMYYYLPLLKSKNNNAYSAIDQYTDAQAAKGAPEAEKTEKSNNVKKAAVTNDYATLIEELKLNLPESKLAILKMIPHAQLLKFLYLFGKDKLLNGFKFFTKEKLLQFIYHIPKEQLIKMLAKLYISMDQVVDQISIKDMNKFLSSKKINKNDLLKIFQGYSSTELAQLAEASTGIPQGNKSHAQLLHFIGDLNTPQITDGIKGLEYKKMRSVVSQMLKQDPTLYTEFSQEALFQQTIDFSKPSLIAGMGVLETEQLVKMLDKLPDNLLSVVVAQIDTNDFAKILVSDFQKLLGSLEI